MCLWHSAGRPHTCPPEGHTCPVPQVLGRDDVAGGAREYTLSLDTQSGIYAPKWRSQFRYNLGPDQARKPPHGPCIRPLACGADPRMTEGKRPRGPLEDPR